MPALSCASGQEVCPPPLPQPPGPTGRLGGPPRGGAAPARRPPGAGPGRPAELGGLRPRRLGVDPPAAPPASRAPAPRRRGPRGRPRGGDRTALLRGSGCPALLTAQAPLPPPGHPRYIFVGSVLGRRAWAAGPRPARQGGRPSAFWRQWDEGRHSDLNTTGPPSGWEALLLNQCA